MSLVVLARRPIQVGGLEGLRQIPGVWILQGHDSLVLLPHGEVAMARAECFGRWEVLASDGTLAHHPGPPDSLRDGLVRVGEGAWVNLHLARVVDGPIELPGGWRVPFEGDLAVAEPPIEAPEDDLLPGQPVRRGEILFLKAGKPTPCWVTARGAVAAHGNTSACARLVPGFLKAGDLRLNPDRLRRVRPQRGGNRGAFLTFDDGTEVRVGRDAARELAGNLGVVDLSWLPPANEGQLDLLEEGLRNWPVELASAPEEFLASEFAGDERRLLANLAWQTAAFLAEGRELPYGRTHRGFWYNPVVLTMIAAGLWDDLEEWDPGPEEGWTLAEDEDPRTPKARLRYVLYCRVLTRLVLERRLLTYRGMGMEDSRPDLHGVGEENPQVVLLVEKDTRNEDVAVLVKTFGLSFMVAGGLPPVIGTEFLAEELLPALEGRPVLVLALVDYDPYGWIAADAFVRHLERYGVAVSGLRHLVLPERFTAEELARLSVPLEAVDGPRKGALRSWMERTGGIGGEERGVHLDHLSLERLLEIVGDVLRGATGLSLQP